MKIILIGIDKFRFCLYDQASAAERSEVDEDQKLYIILCVTKSIYIER